MINSWIWTVINIKKWLITLDNCFLLYRTLLNYPVLVSLLSHLLILCLIGEWTSLFCIMPVNLYIFVVNAYLARILFCVMFLAINT